MGVFDNNDVIFLDPEDFGEELRKLIERIVYYKLISTGIYKQDEIDELVQSIFEKFLTRLDVIRSHYRKEARLTTYLTVIITNFCYQIYREQKKEFAIVTIPIDKALSQVYSGKNKNLYTLNEGEYKLYLDDVIKKLDITFSFLGDQKNRILVLLKLFYGLPINKNEVLAFCRATDYQTFSSRINQNSYSEKTNSERYELINDIINVCENRHNKPDAIRKEINKYLKEFIRSVNGSPSVYTFDKETFRFLFEKYCDHFSKNTSDNNL